MLKNVYLYLMTILVFFALDMLWLGLVAKDFYRRELGYLLRAETKWAAAIVFYFLFIAGLLMFAVLPALEKGSIQRAVYLGAAFGFFCYATFDLTCYALIKNFPLKMVIVDLIWGTLLSGTVSSASFFLAKLYLQ